MAKTPQDGNTDTANTAGAKRTGAQGSTAKRAAKPAAKSTAKSTAKSAAKSAAKSTAKSGATSKAGKAGRAQAAGAESSRTSRTKPARAPRKTRVSPPDERVEDASRDGSWDDVTQDPFDEELLHEEPFDDEAFDAETAPSDAAFSAVKGGRGVGRAPLKRRGDETYLDFLARMFDDMSSGDWSHEQIDALTQGYGMVLGSSPALVALESMVSNVSSQSAVMMNAAQTQRQLDQVGLCCTSACVKQLLSLNSGNQDD